MEKKRQWKYLALGAIVIAVSSMGFSFASMSTQLDIKGFATMGSANWSVYFDNLSNANIIGQTIEVKHPTITNNSTSISTFDVKFQYAKDGISYDFEIVNDGGMNAKITTLNLSNPTCTGSGLSSKEDEELVCNNIKYTFQYLDGTEVKIGDVLEKNTRKSVRMTLLYNGDELPVEEVRIMDIGLSVIYSQDK